MLVHHYMCTHVSCPKDRTTGTCNIIICLNTQTFRTTFFAKFWTLLRQLCVLNDLGATALH